MRLKIPWIKSPFFYLPGLLLLLLLFLLLSTLTAASTNFHEELEDRALFWTIEKNGSHAGYLLGTIHSEDPRVLEFSEDFLNKLGSCGVFAMELVPDLPTLARLTEVMHYPTGQSLQSVIGAEQFSQLLAALSSYHVPVDSINRMKPWAAMMTLSTPPPATGFFMDLSLSLRASGNGLKVVGLETLEQQISFLEEMPQAMQLSLLDQAIADFDQVSGVHDQMVDVYLRNDLLELQEVSEEQMQSAGEEATRYFMELGIHARNQRMTDTLLTHLEHNTVFAAVGALHLPGDQGIINLLRKQGFKLSPNGLPFPPDADTP